MSQVDIAKLIQEHFEFVKAPTESEVDEIILRLSSNTTEEDFRKIVYDVVKNKISHASESVDMSASKSLLLQIKKAAGKP
jgi:hypothetical protein